MIRATLVLVLLLAGCSTVCKQPEVVVSGCRVDLPERPVMQTGSGEYPGDAVAVGVLAGDLEAQERYATALEVALIGCADASDPK